MQTQRSSADADYEPASRTLVSQGLKLHYVDWGNEGAPVLLLVHGMRDHSRGWDWTAQSLRHEWHVIAPDLRGHGDSQWSPDGAYLTAYHVLDIANLVETLGCKRFALVGHSFGGVVCARYASLFPERAQKLVLVDCLGASEDQLAAWTEHAVQLTREWVEKRRKLDAQIPRRFATVEAAAARMASANPRLSERQVSHLAAHGLRRHDDGYGWKYDPVIGLFLPEDFALDGLAFWRSVAVPTLLCWPTESWTTDPEHDGRAAQFRDHRTVIFQRAGHWLHHEQLDTFVSALRDFL